MDIVDLIDIEIIKISKETILNSFTRKTVLWCKLPYKNNKNGCINYNKNPLCPPNSPYLFEFTKTYNYFYLIYCIFNFYKYKMEMLKTHDYWSIGMAGNRRHWQSQIKKYLRLYIENIFKLNKDKKLYLLFCGSGLKGSKIIKQDKIYSLEAVGINVFKLLKNNNIDFEVKPKNIVKLVTLLYSDKIIIEEKEEIEVNQLI